MNRSLSSRYNFLSRQNSFSCMFIYSYQITDTLTEVTVYKKQVTDKSNRCWINKRMHQNWIDINAYRINAHSNCLIEQSVTVLLYKHYMFHIKILEIRNNPWQPRNHKLQPVKNTPQELFASFRLIGELNVIPVEVIVHWSGRNMLSCRWISVCRHWQGQVATGQWRPFLRNLN